MNVLIHYNKTENPLSSSSLRTVLQMQQFQLIVTELYSYVRFKFSLEPIPPISSRKIY